MSSRDDFNALFEPSYGVLKFDRENNTIFLQVNNEDKDSYGPMNLLGNELSYAERQYNVRFDSKGEYHIKDPSKLDDLILFMTRI